MLPAASVCRGIPQRSDGKHDSCLRIYRDVLSTSGERGPAQISGPKLRLWPETYQKKGWLHVPRSVNLARRQTGLWEAKDEVLGESSFNPSRTAARSSTIWLHAHAIINCCRIQ